VLAAAARGGPPVAPLALPPGTRALVVAPHPDDESIGAGGLLRRLGPHATVVVVTDGDGYLDGVNQILRNARPAAAADFLAYGGRRHDEAAAAVAALGLPAGSLRFLGFPDGGLDALWADHWSADRPWTSPWTGAARSAPADGAALPYTGEALTAELGRLLTALRPTLIVVPDPEDVHADHATAGRFVIEALARLAPSPAPDVVAYLIHDPLWPPPPAEEWGAPPPPARLACGEWLALDLTADERHAKRRAVRAHATQIHAMPELLRKFLRRRELYRRLPPLERAAIAARH
jgi:LmbE family N-acetylglucosaminyl deacetylase